MCVSCLSSISVAISFHPFHSRFLARCTLVHSAHKMHIIWKIYTFCRDIQIYMFHQANLRRALVCKRKEYICLLFFGFCDFMMNLNRNRLIFCWIPSNIWVWSCINVRKHPENAKAHFALSRANRCEKRACRQIRRFSGAACAPAPSRPHAARARHLALSQLN